MHSESEALLDNLAWVRRLATRLVADAHRAEDVAQSALCEALAHPPPFAGDLPRLRRWLGGIVRHEARNSIGRESERPWREQQAARGEVQRQSNHVEAAESRDALIAGLNQLSVEDRQRLVWHYLEGSSVAVIAVREGASPSTTRKRMERARGRLRDWLDQRYGDRGTWCAALATLAETPSARAGLGAARMWGALALACVAALGGWFALRPSGSSGSVVLALGPSGPGPAPSSIGSAIAAHTSAVRPTAAFVFAAEDGKPLAGATVVARDRAGHTWTGVTGPDGSVELPEGAETDWLAAGMEARVPVALAPVRASRGSSLLLEMATPLAGRVQGFGPIPERLALTSFVDPLGPAPPWVAGGLRRAGVPGRLPHSVPLDAQGRWSVDGIPARWSGRLHAPEHTWWAGPGGAAEVPDQGDRPLRHAVELSEPRAGLTLAIQALPRVQGRVVHAESGEPLAFARVRLVPFIEGDTARRTFEIQSDSDGTFELSYGPGAAALDGAWLGAGRPRIERLELAFELDGFSSQRLSLRGPDPPGSLLGDVALRPIPELVATVTSRAGDSLAGALALVGASMSRPSEADGLVRVQAAGKGGPVWMAPGHRRRRVEPGRSGRRSADPGESAATVELEKGGDVVLRFEAKQALRADERASLRVELLAKSKPFEGAEERHGFPTPVGVPAQVGFERASARQVALGAAAWRAPVSLDADGRARLGGFDPGVELELVARDRFGRVLGRAQGTTPAGQGSLALTLRHDGDLSPLRLRVVDGSGLGIPHASVEFQAGGVDGSCVADRSGEATLGCCAEPLHALWVDAAAPGFAAQRFDGLVWEPGDDALVLQLEPARALRVAVDLPGGAAPREIGLIARWSGGQRLSGRQVEPAVFVFDALPRGEVELLLSLDGVDYPRVVPAGATDFSLVVRAAE